MVSQTRKNSHNIERVTEQIANAILIQNVPADQVLDAHEYFDIINRQRAAKVESLVLKYRSIGSLLIKTESLVANTNTGKSKELKEYYAHWERKVFMSLNYVQYPYPDAD